MSVYTTIVEQLTAERDDLERVVGEAQQRLAALECAIEAIGLLDARPAVPVPTPSTPAATADDGEQQPTAKQSTMRQFTAERVVCPDCGGEFSRAGIGPHRRAHKNGTTTAAGKRKADADRKRRSRAAAAAGNVVADSMELAPPKPPATAAGGKVLACDSCDAVFPIDKVMDLVRHTHNEHNRPPTHTERTPVNR